MNGQIVLLPAALPAVLARSGSFRQSYFLVDVHLVKTRWQAAIEWDSVLRTIESGLERRAFEPPARCI
jgi:hypothetical protein